jgi:starch-binding outer membrane protein, SusD/RagB family
MIKAFTMTNKIIKNIIFLFIVTMATNFVSCKKFVDTAAPETQINAANVYNDEVTATAVLTGIYSRIAQGLPTPNIASGIRSFSLLCGLSADEYTLFTGANTEMLAFYQNALVAGPNDNIGTAYWTVIYDHIYSCNNSIEGLNNSKGLTEPVKQQLLGEAKFMRAFFYFYLVNLYGDVPLITSTDYKINANLSRSPKEDVYKQIIIDLKDAQELLSAEYLDGKLQKYATNAERVRPNKSAALALLARGYLYSNDWVNAESQATAVLNNTALYDTTSLNNVFLKANLGNKEAIWQLQVVKSNQNTDDSKMFIVTTGFSNTTPVRLSDTLLNSFEPGDQRVKPKNWVDTIRIPAITGALYYFPYKYKNNAANVTEYLTVLRLAEQYLIRSEARARQNNLAGAIADLDVIRKRAGLPLIANINPGISQSNLLDKILHERQVEFFSEWGHRWFDLKRTNNLDALMTVITPKKANGQPWRPFQKLYPIPFSELQSGVHLSQTPGYQ